jgi:sporulation-control protein
MSFFKKMMASVGIGAAKVDTVLNGRIASPGGTLEGVVHVKGGNVDQEIEDIMIALMVDVKREMNDSTVYQPMEIAKYRVAGRFKISAGEALQLPFSIQIPLEIPITVLGQYKLGNIKLYVKTLLDIDNAMDKADKDYLEIQPLPNMEKFLHALLELGFQFHKADVEYGRIPGSNYSFYEEIEFFGYHSQFPKIKELEVTFIAKPDGVQAVLEMDKRGLFGSREKYKTVFLPHDDRHINYLSELQAVLARV